MYSLLSGLWKYLFSKNEYFILILGLDGAGKTTLLEQIKTKYTKVPGLPPHKIIPTVGLNIAKTQYEEIKLTYWDLGGQSQLRSIWNKYFTDVHAVIYVVDSNDKERFTESKDELESIVCDPKLKGVPLLLFFNKQDLPDSESIEFLTSVFKSVINNQSLSSSEDGTTISRNVQLQSLIASKGEGISEGIKWLADNLRKNARTIEKTDY
ncbi:arfrp1, ARF-like GTPase [Dictyostelium purpureum]|uniref:Arfrp1, ARF-like GTPase n=1 Tax=Dictyostelium purpureum TaxID=5786 RepID=F0ZE73_DICPU|nr:arfrp1, ARF-like GTPase [Dictyostelium purpureum]EGC37775.1 arfrp1, ARF-like GTPase [Dictyostelium purpureum]|eukprot:XP_003285714.1 arfrp1, ARF-like GTPase [Dictyostelium purpureum]